jgi:hypothetical protein
VTRSRIALVVLAALAVLSSVNLFTGTRAFVNAYRVYDEMGLELTRFDYVDPASPVAIEMVVSNPTGETFDVKAFDMRLDAGVRRVGGGVLYLNPAARFPAGHRQAFPIELHIDDEDYVERLTTPNVDWRVTGRVQVVLAQGIDPVWISFVVRQLPQ